MKRFWVSWYDAEPDCRPLTDPPTKEVLGWWISGETMTEPTKYALCALVESESEDKARAALVKNWPEFLVSEERFFSEKPADFVPGDRFPMKEVAR
jgi:hypothetical protein